MGTEERDKFLAFSVSLGLLPLIFRGVRNVTHGDFQQKAAYSDSASISSCLIIVDIGEL